MSGATDSGMMKMMGVVIAAVTVIALLCALAARLLGMGGDDADDPLMRNALMQRIEPVASVRTSADDLPEGSGAEMAVASGPKTGEELVNGACAACHAAGVANAPMIGDDAAWSVRRELGLEALVSSVINGKGSMPARGGSAYTDEEVLSAVQFMAGFEVEEPAATETEAPAAEEAPSTEAPATEEAATEDAAAEKTAETESIAPEAAARVATVGAVVGAIPEGLTDIIKTNVDGLCAGCHISGLGNAPKIGDVVAWQERADKGMEALTSSVINGLNIMPPRGGSALSDEEIPIAIQYLMSK